jgi:hypothetical protein
MKNATISLGNAAINNRECNNKIEFKISSTTFKLLVLTPSLFSSFVKAIMLQQIYKFLFLA